jgi:uncharacterized protein
MSSHVGLSARPPAPSSDGVLPATYGVTRLVLMPRDPLWAHAYWEIAPYTWTEAEKTFGPGLRAGGRSVLRFFKQDDPRPAFDLDVHLDARNWYARLEGAEGPWRAELGLLLPDGRFVRLAISNTLHMPGGRVSDLMDEKWAILRSDWERLFELSGAGRLGAGSLDMTRMLSQRWELLSNLSSGAVLGGGSSWSKPPQAGAKAFWLTADAEVIVYGATEPDARVTFQGRPVRLETDGTFSFRLALPDGRQKFPITAVNKDGDLSESVEISVTRGTQKRG